MWELIGRYDVSHSGTLDRYEFETMVTILSSLLAGYEPEVIRLTVIGVSLIGRYVVSHASTLDQTLTIILPSLATSVALQERLVSLGSCF